MRIAIPSDERRCSIQPGPLDQVATTPCRLRVPDSTPQSAARALAYTPLSARCKFNIFLTSTYSPYTFASAGFQATEALGNWAMAALWRRCARLGEAVGRDAGEYRITEIHPDLCSVDDLASGASC
jgi:hypothetical protein